MATLASAVPRGASTTDFPSNQKRQSAATGRSMESRLEGVEEEEFISHGRLRDHGAALAASKATLAEHTITLRTHADGLAAKKREIEELTTSLIAHRAEIQRLEGRVTVLEKESAEKAAAEKIRKRCCT